MQPPYVSQRNAQIRPRENNQTIALFFPSSSMTVNPWVRMAAKLESEESSVCSWHLFLSLIMLELTECEFEDSNMMEIPKFQ